MEKVRVAEAIEPLPAMGDALGTGELSDSAVREIARSIGRYLPAPSPP